MYDINAHMVRNTASAFGGSEKKRTIFLDDGNMYMLKLPDPAREAHRDISYINNALSEYLGCKIYKEIGIPVQDVILGEYKALSSKGEQKTYIACLCRSLATGGYVLAPAETAALSSESGRHIASIPKFETVDRIAECIPEIPPDDLKAFYSDMFVVDAFLGNTDRHNGNWGFLIGPEETKISPVYDCGSCLCPLLSESELTGRKAVGEAMNGMSVLTDNGHRIEYRSYLMSGENEAVNDALKRIVPRIQMNNISDLVNQTPYISEKRKAFYNTFLQAKYEQVLVPALEHVLEQNISHDGRCDYNFTAYAQYVSFRNVFRDIGRHVSGDVYINNHQVHVTHATGNQYILSDPGTGYAEAVIALRSNNSNVWKMLQTISQTYDIPLKEIRISADAPATCTRELGQSLENGFCDGDNDIEKTTHDNNSIVDDPTYRNILEEDEYEL